MMPNTYILILFISLTLLSIGCRDQQCEVSEWIGEYHLVSEECDGQTAVFDSIFNITDGFGDNTLRLNNGFFDVVGCDAEISNLATLELDNDELIARGMGCTATFIRQ